MREIKFRIWDKKNAKFISKWERVFINAWECCVYTKSELEKSNFSYYNDLSEIEVNQFTGLKDKYGKEIYEGDIVKFGDGEIVEVVFFCGAFMPKLEKGQCVKIDYNAKPVWQDGEIIGNIHENPELLGGKK